MPLNEIIAVRSLAKSFGKIKAVDDISFRVEEGELFALLGPNGAGKSTTINILCTLLPKDAGEIEICGFKAGRDDQHIRRSIGVVFQENSLDDLLTVKQNLVSRAFLYTADRRRIESGIDRVCAVLQLGELLGRPFGRLSGGQKRRCEIARALINAPQILFLDEPTTGLDPQTRQNVWDSIEFLRRELGTTVFLTTHYLEEAAKATHVAIIDEGRIAALDTPAALKGRFTSDLLKVEADDAAGVRTFLTGRDAPYEERNGLFEIKVEHSLEALAILKGIEGFVASFEVVHGTMDDVFLAITGKALRED